MSKYKINKGFIVQRLDNKITIFDGEKSVLYSFNDTASYIFSKIKSGWDKKRIVKAVVNRYDIQPKKILDDFNDLTKDLLVKKVITQKTE